MVFPFSATVWMHMAILDLSFRVQKLISVPKIHFGRKVKHKAEVNWDGENCCRANIIETLLAGSAWLKSRTQSFPLTVSKKLLMTDNLLFWDVFSTVNQSAAANFYNQTLKVKVTFDQKEKFTCQLMTRILKENNFWPKNPQVLPSQRGVVLCLLGART